jgi:hypothetical protein
MPRGPKIKTNSLRAKEGRWTEKGRREAPAGLAGGNADRYGKGSRPFDPGEVDFDPRPTRAKK